jgi:hypothetical protein
MVKSERRRKELEKIDGIERGTGIAKENNK